MVLGFSEKLNHATKANNLSHTVSHESKYLNALLVKSLFFEKFSHVFVWAVFAQTTVRMFLVAAIYPTSGLQLWDNYGDHCSGSAESILRHNALRDPVYQTFKSKNLVHKLESITFITSSPLYPSDILKLDWTSWQMLAIIFTITKTIFNYLGLYSKQSHSAVPHLQVLLARC